MAPHRITAPGRTYDLLWLVAGVVIGLVLMAAYVALQRGAFPGDDYAFGQRVAHALDVYGSVGESDGRCESAAEAVYATGFTRAELESESGDDTLSQAQAFFRGCTDMAESDG